MTNGFDPQTRYGEAFWQAHHEEWMRSDLNQREYHELHTLPLKRFENCQAKFKADASTTSTPLPWN
ncbi:MAG: hypothetical protein KDA48_13555 [Amphiplicatus sp.]|nr:hypothetical protein [Amphiplicatus sp.]